MKLDMPAEERLTKKGIDVLFMCVYPSVVKKWIVLAYVEARLGSNQSWDTLNCRRLWREMSGHTSRTRGSEWAIPQY